MENKTKIMVTGANGQLGSELQWFSKYFPQYDFNFTDVGDIDITNACQLEEFIKNNPADIIINCAAYTAVDKAETDH